MSRIHLQCRECRREYEPAFRYVCEECFGPLDVAYDPVSCDAGHLCGQGADLLEVL